MREEALREEERAERALAELENKEALATEEEKGQHAAALYAAQDDLAVAQKRYTAELERAAEATAEEAEAAAVLCSTQALASHMHAGEADHARQIKELYAQAKAAQENVAVLREKNLALEEEVRRCRGESHAAVGAVKALQEDLGQREAELETLTVTHRERLIGVEGDLVIVQHREERVARGRKEHAVRLLLKALARWTDGSSQLHIRSMLFNMQSDLAKGIDAVRESLTQVGRQARGRAIRLMRQSIMRLRRGRQVSLLREWRLRSGVDSHGATVTRLQGDIATVNTVLRAKQVLLALRLDELWLSRRFGFVSRWRFKMYDGVIQEYRQTHDRFKSIVTGVHQNAIGMLTRVLRKWREGSLGSCIGEWLQKIAGDRLYQEFERTNSLHREQAAEKASVMKGVRDKEKELRKREKALEAAYAGLGVEEAPTIGRRQK